MLVMGFQYCFLKDRPGLGNMEALGLDLFSPTFDFLYTAIWELAFL